MTSNKNLVIKARESSPQKETIRLRTHRNGTAKLEVNAIMKFTRISCRATKVRVRVTKVLFDPNQELAIATLELVGIAKHLLH